mmetsp:Transcript_35218/g.82114  ORF Transcript_35218/g.82114 Transcript_35218/m.82114 type:complete len:525 (-) Transcript_35218:65-1639(-)
MCEIDVLPGLPENCRCSEVEELFGRFGKVDYLFIPPPLLRRSEPSFIKFWSPDGAQAAFKASKDNQVILHGHRLQLEFHKAPVFVSARALTDGSGGSTSSRPPDPPPLPAWTQNGNPEVDDFVRRHNLCSKAENELRELPMADQLALIRKPYKDIRSMDAVVISQSRSLKGKDPESGRAQFGSGGARQNRPRRGRTGKGGGFGRGSERAQLVKNTGEHDKRLHQFIQVNKLDDDCAKILQRHSKEVQAAVIDAYVPDLTIRANRDDGRTLNTSAIVTSRVRKEREKILEQLNHGIRLKESMQAGSRSPGASPRRRRSSSEDDRSRSRSSPRRSRSEDSSSGRSARQQDDNAGAAPEGVDIVGAEAQGNDDRGRRAAPHRSVSLSRSRSDSRSMEPKNDAQSQPQRRVVVNQAEENKEDDSSPLLEICNLPDLISRGKNPLQYLPELFNPTLKTLPDFNKEMGGESVLKAWNKPGKVGAILLQLQNKALAASACRTLNGLQFLGFELKVQGIPKLEADGLLQSAP